MRHPHDVLGVEADADLPTIKRAFRALAKELHPDRNADPSAGVRFRELLEAYDQAVKDAAARATWASLRPSAPHEASAVDFDAVGPTPYAAGDDELRGVSPAAFCTAAYQERLTRIVVSSRVGSVVMLFVSSVLSHF